MNWIAALWRAIGAAASFPVRWLLARWPWRKSRRFRGERVEEFPDALQRAKIYLAGEGDNLWAAALICPCGCGDVIELNLLKQARPCWSVQEHQDGSVSIDPSVWRSKGCKSHFYVRHGRIDWC